MEPSRIYSFLDEEYGIACHLFEGQKALSDLVVEKALSNEAVSFFRAGVLSTQPLIAFLKPSEGFGLYIDNADPYFMYKIETNFSGKMRTLFLPQDMPQIPQKLSGICRLSKTIQGKKPYTSIIEFKSESFEGIINKVLTDSYQVDGKVYVSEKSDQSLFLMKLPQIGGEGQFNQDISLSEYWMKRQRDFIAIMDKGLNKENEIKAALKNLKLTQLGEKEIEITCPCTKDGFLEKVLTLSQADQDHLFENEQQSLTLTCDYCQKQYEIKRGELFGH